MHKGWTWAVVAAAGVGFGGGLTSAHGRGAGVSTHADPRVAFVATISSVSASRVTVSWRHDHVVFSSTLATNNLTVYAGPYPGALTLLAPGEPVQVRQPHGHAILELRPVASGVLQVSSTGDTLIANHRVLTLANASPERLGLPALSSGTPVLAFGTRHGQTVTDVALAARPTVWAATLVDNQSGDLVFKTAHGMLNYVLPPHAPPRWDKAPAGTRVRLLVSPVVRTVLAVLPAKHRSLSAYGVLVDRVAGTVTQVTSASVTVQNALGGETVNVSSWHVTVVWPHHSGVPLSAVQPGWEVALVAYPHARHLIVRVVRAAS
jgi:hypothetical protein